MSSPPSLDASLMRASGSFLIFWRPSMCLKGLSKTHFLQFPAHWGLRIPGSSASVLERSSSSSSSLLEVCLTPLILSLFFPGMRTGIS